MKEQQKKKKNKNRKKQKRKKAKKSKRSKGPKKKKKKKNYVFSQASSTKVPLQSLFSSKVVPSLFLTLVVVLFKLFFLFANSPARFDTSIFSCFVREFMENQKTPFEALVPTFIGKNYFDVPSFVIGDKLIYHLSFFKNASRTRHPFFGTLFKKI